MSATSIVSNASIASNNGNRKNSNNDNWAIWWNIMNYGKPNEIACQLPLMDHLVFLQIGKRECIAQVWKKEDKWEEAPNLLQMIGQFNSVSQWCQIQWKMWMWYNWSDMNA